MNLLVGKSLVHMNYSMSWPKNSSVPNSQFTVSDLNTGSSYEEYCKSIDRLRKQLAQQPKYIDLNREQIDAALMGRGGKTPSLWRQYVKKNRDT